MSEILTGQAATESEAGFKPLSPSTSRSVAVFETPREAARSLPIEKAPAADVVAYRHGGDGGEVAPANQTVRVEDAADGLTAYRARQADDRALSISADFAEAIDRMRAEGVQIDEVPGEPALPVRAAPIAAPLPVAPVDVVSQSLAIPAVQDAISAQLDQTLAVREQYSAGLENAFAFSQAAIHEVAPELANVPLDRFQEALHLLAQVSPPKFNSVVRLLDHVGRIQAAKASDEANREAQRAEWARRENERYEAATRDLTPGQRRAVSAEMVSFAKDLGIPQQNLVHLMKTEPVLQSAEFQLVMLEAVASRINQKAAKNATANLSKHRAVPPVPLVQRPGVSVGRSERSHADMQRLNAQLAQSGNLKDAFELLKAKRK